MEPKTSTGGKMPMVTDGLSFFTVDGVMGQVNRHPVLFFFGACVLFFMGVEYTLAMVPSTSPPFDIGLVLTRPLNILLADRPNLNSALAALNTVFVVMQTVYILWALLMEQTPRATISALYMFTCRGILGYCIQLPLPKEFLGSGMDFPVGNVSFFLFFPGHVAGGLIASLDMRRVRRDLMPNVFDALNLLQALRLLATRGHYTIDLAVGIGAGIFFDLLAGKYEDGKVNKHMTSNGDRGPPAMAVDYTSTHSAEEGIPGLRFATDSGVDGTRSDIYFRVSVV